MADARADTFAKLLMRNAVRFAERPAMRHKDFGIWHTWTWAQLLAEIRAYAAGLSRLGLTRGDRIAIIGANRPKLYWSIMAAQMLGAIPVPIPLVERKYGVNVAQVGDKTLFASAVFVLAVKADIQGERLRRSRRRRRDGGAAARSRAARTNLGGH